MRLPSLIAALLVPTLAFAGEVPLLTADDVAALRPVHRSAKAAQKAAAAEARLAIVREAAQVVGAQSGYAARAREIRTEVEARAESFDRIFHFGPLLIDGRLLMPAIERVERVGAIDESGAQLRETAAVFRVVESARLVSVPPTWRDYLSVYEEQPEIEIPERSLFPVTSEEEVAWEEASRAAWAVGARQAELVFETEFEVLVQQYEGRLRYLELAEKGMVSRASLAQEAYGVVREDAELRIDDRLYRVATDAVFARADAWRATVIEAGALPGTQSTGMGEQAKPVVRLRDSADAQE